MTARRRQAVDLLRAFAERTGLGALRPPERYLWTDAFAVCTLLGLARETGERAHEELALRLIDQVHHVLGRHRPDDARRGWLSGLGEAEGEAHPTRGGLRIGKPLPERGPGEAADERLEWDRDGQYLHYLTKWMHALDQATRATRRPLFTTWARELARAAHRAFTHAPRPGAPPRLYWKVSVDGSRPLVASMGQHDALDGYVTCAQLEATAPGAEPAVRDVRAAFASMIDLRGLATDDPLGLGGLLADAARLAQVARGDTDARLVAAMLDAARAGLAHWAAGPALRVPAAHRLAFRELGLAIGLAALDLPVWRTAPDDVQDRVARLRPYADLRAAIEDCWLEPRHRLARAWIEHANIDDVMLAASLAPDGVLVLGPPP